MYTALLRFFQSFDRDRDGVLSIREAVLGLQEVRQPLGFLRMSWDEAGAHALKGFSGTGPRKGETVKRSRFDLFSFMFFISAGPS